MIEHVAVVVPARNERAELPACLSGLARACAHGGLAGISVSVVVVLDRCTDGSGETVAHYCDRLPRLRTLTTSVGRVGSARACGAIVALLGGERAPDSFPDPAATWLASTDADTVVPPNWLARQIAGAADGWDAVAGTVHLASWPIRPSWTARDLPARFQHYYETVTGCGDGHRHVHGANLGVRGSAYLAAGGFPPLAEGEDHALVEALESAGARIMRTGKLPVATSGRSQARAPNGFAAFLGTLTQ